ncbi:MAG: 50S ribosomal protein L25 [bacterium]
MATEEIRIKADSRTEQGSSAVGRLRRAGSVPAAVNRIGGGTTLVKFDAHAFKAMLRHHTSDHVLVMLELDGKDVPALMREVQYHVLTGYPIHVDFGEVSLTTKLRVSIPVRLFGEPEGVKVGGGILQQSIRMIEVDCLPTDIIEHFDADVSGLGLDQSLFVRDLKIDGKYTVLTAKDVPVATVVAAEEEIVEAPAEGEAPVETPDVLAKGKKEEGAAAPAAAGNVAAPAAKAPATKK